jgi:hypothetical protein
MIKFHFQIVFIFIMKKLIKKNLIFLFLNLLHDRIRSIHVTMSMEKAF